MTNPPYVSRLKTIASDAPPELMRAATLIEREEAMIERLRYATDVPERARIDAELYEIRRELRLLGW